MSDSIDSAVNRAKNRDLYLGTAVKYLGAERQRDAEFLADQMSAAVDQICASANVKIAPNPDISAALMKQIGDQALRHGEAIAHGAVRTMTDVFLKVLICAARARGIEGDELH